MITVGGVSVTLSVSLPNRRSSATTRPIVTNFFVCVTYGGGSFFFCRRRDTSCTCGFVDDVIFAHNGHENYVLQRCRWEQPASQPAWWCLGHWQRRLGLRAGDESLCRAFRALFVIRGSVPFSQSLPERTVRMGMGVKTQTVPHILTSKRRELDNYCERVIVLIK